MNVFDKQHWNIETGLEALIRIRTNGAVKLTICPAHGISFSNDEYCAASDTDDLPFGGCGLAVDHAVITKDQHVKLMITLAELLLECYEKDLEKIAMMQKIAQELINERK